MTEFRYRTRSLDLDDLERQSVYVPLTSEGSRTAGKGFIYRDAERLQGHLDMIDSVRQVSNPVDELVTGLTTRTDLPDEFPQLPILDQVDALGIAVATRDTFLNVMNSDIVLGSHHFRFDSIPLAASSKRFREEIGDTTMYLGQVVLFASPTMVHPAFLQHDRLPFVVLARIVASHRYADGNLGELAWYPHEKRWPRSHGHRSR
jgi:hypothetical protein